MFDFFGLRLIWSERYMKQQIWITVSLSFIQNITMSDANPVSLDPVTNKDNNEAEV